MKPTRRVTEWTPVLLNGEWVNLSGRDQFGEPWFSSTVAEIDVEARTAKTISGRPYVFVGPHCPEEGLRSALLTLAQHGWDVSTGTLEAITLEQAAAWLAGQAETPTMPPEDVAVAEERRAAKVWQDLQWARFESGWTDERVVEETGLPLEAVRNLRRGPQSLDGVDLDLAEEAVGTLRVANMGWRM